MTFWLTSRPRRGSWHATIAVKAAWRLMHDGIASPDETKPPAPSGDDPPEPGAALRYASDFVPHKPKADFLVVGNAHAPKAEPVRRCRVSISINGQTKSLAVLGDRQWVWGPAGARPCEPTPFVAIPLGYDRAFGGPSSRSNPVGCGVDVRAGEKLPNVEHLDRLITQPTHRPEPAGFGPVAMTWRPRIDKAGTYDAAWLDQRWPWVPTDFDWSFFNAAPVDQQFPYFRGDEELTFANMHPEQATYRSRLPGVRPRVFINRIMGDASQFDEAQVKLDTIWVDVPAEQLVLVWRGAIRVHSPRMREIAAIYTTLEPLDAHLDSELHRSAFAVINDANPTAEVAVASRAEVERRREEAEARIGEACALASSLRQTADGILQAAGFQARRAKAKQAAEDPMETLQKAIATLKERSAAKGQVLEDRLLDVDSKIGELMGQVPQRLRWTRELVVEALARRDSLEKAGLDGLDLASVDFAGADLRDATLRGAALQDARLDRAHLAGADLTKCDLTNASLTAADLSRANLTDAIAGRVTFAAARIDATIFCKCDLTGADFSGTSGQAPDFTEAKLDDARFTDAKLPRALFTSAYVARVDFRNAHLEAADFSAAKAPGIIMEGADLTNLRASCTADFSDGRFGRAQAPRSVWQQTMLDRAEFSRAVLSHALFSEASLRDARFDRAHLQGANFDDAVLVGAQVTNTNLLRASFERADLTNARVDGCSLYGAGLLDAVLEGTTFQGSMVVQTLLAR